MRTITKNLLLSRHLCCKSALTTLFLNSLRQKGQYGVFLVQQHQDYEFKKKLQGRKRTLPTSTPPPQFRHERLLIKQMVTASDIIQFLEKMPPQDMSVYAVAIKRCFELKQPNAFHQIIKLIHQKNISLSIIFCNTVLHYLGFWNKLDLQKKLFEQWFICKQFAPNTAHLDPDEISLNEMIKGCSKRGDVKQALYYFELLI
ncbi:hypothetical protein RFI_17953 [Reticulomyxa filosa]|uniref:Pentatricopeptide repeat-containing protein n=1 Tax=Reticulomyxa filosa TaxID=46433 RepID=X6N0L0_RETFI|nr:hypothetical protein RFI_17953 [Reticulomyxa filosa]|eukprot:ETO19279.1 hypothetical protein RFI_17953 [Reticulomyxa filosa]